MEPTTTPYIHHISFAVADPGRVAEALARLLGATVMRFPVHAGSYMVNRGGPFGPGIELYPLGVELVRDAATETVAFRTVDAAGPLSGHSATHAAISVPATEQEIYAVAAEQGWPARRMQRGPFDFVELWVEGRVMLELFPADLEKRPRFGGGGPPGP
ncbi:MAG: hypothetical protein R3B09_11820 [Nannocystaceae bacterium]